MYVDFGFRWPKPDYYPAQQSDESKGDVQNKEKQDCNLKNPDSALDQTHKNEGSEK